MRRSFHRLIGGVAALALLCGGVGQAQAGFLNDTVTIDFIYPTAGAVYSSSGPLTVSPTASFAPFGNATATVSDTQLTFTALFGTFYTTASFNGFTITDTSRNPSITGVTIDPVTSPGVGFDPSRISFTSNSVSVNLQSLSFSSTDNVTLDLSFGGTAVPEPTSLTLLGLGVAGLAGYGWRRRQPQTNA